MAGKSSLMAVPEALRLELSSRQSDQPYLTLDDHLVWLSEQGYAISRSALGRYLVAQKNSSPLTAEQREAQQGEVLVRLRCLEVASSLVHGGTHEELMLLTKNLLGWVQTGQSR